MCVYHVRSHPLVPDIAACAVRLIVPKIKKTTKIPRGPRMPCFSDKENAPPLFTGPRVGAGLSAEQGRRQVHVPEGDKPEAELPKHALPVERLEDLEGGDVVQAPSRHAVDVGQGEIDVRLRERVEGAPLREYLPEVQVVVLHTPLLPRRVRVAVEEARPAPACQRGCLDRDGVGELGPVVREAQREHPAEHAVAERLLKPVEHVQDGPGRVRLAQEGEHQAAVVEVHGEQHLRAPPAPFDRVDLHDGRVGVRLGERLEVLHRPAGAAFPVDLPLRALLPARLHPHRHGQVTPRRAGEEPAVDVPVDRLFAAGELAAVRRHDVVDGLPFRQPRRQDTAHPRPLGLREGGPLARRAQKPAVGLVRRVVDVVLLPQHAPVLVAAAVADIRGRAEAPAHLLLEEGAGVVAFRARPAQLARAGGVAADQGAPAVVSVDAPVGQPPERPLVAVHAVLQHLAGHGRVAFPDLDRDLLEGLAVPQAVLDQQTLVVGEMGHVFLLVLDLDAVLSD